jgi:hypothetical protein
VARQAGGVPRITLTVAPTAIEAFAVLPALGPELVVADLGAVTSTPAGIQFIRAMRDAVRDRRLQVLWVCHPGGSGCDSRESEQALAQFQARLLGALRLAAPPAAELAG